MFGLGHSRYTTLRKDYIAHSHSCRNKAEYGKALSCMLETLQRIVYDLP